MQKYFLIFFSLYEHIFLDFVEAMDFTVWIEGRDAVFACCSGANIHSITTWHFTYTLKYLTNEGPPWWLTMIDWPIGGRHCTSHVKTEQKKFIATEQKHQDAKTASRPSIRTVYHWAKEIETSPIMEGQLTRPHFDSFPSPINLAVKHELHLAKWAS